MPARESGTARPRWYDGILAALDSREDSDRVFSYYTKQQVSFLDRRLGITFYFLILLIVVYIVGYMFIYKKGYEEYEQAKGAVATHVYGDALSISSGKQATRYFSTEEITYPGLENGNLFIATRQTVHRQMRGFCEDPTTPCATDADCTSGGEGRCGDSGFCVEHSWCDQEAKPEIYEIDTANLQIWTRSSIQFVKIDPERVLSNDGDTPVPKRGVNTFSVSDLLLKCEPLPVRYEEVAELGAAVEVQFIWNCGKREKDCMPEMRARRLDTIFDPDNIGFGFNYPEYLDEDHRLRNEVRGIRIFFRTYGTGKKFSVAATITKASMGASLFALAQIVADLLMTKLFFLRNKYKARKYENTPDFSEYMQEVDAKKAFAVTPKQMDEEEHRVHQNELFWMRQLDEEAGWDEEA